MKINDDDLRLFGEHLKKVCQLRGMTQELIADKISVNRSTISNWFRGRGIPSARNLQKLSDALNLPINALLQFDDAYSPYIQAESSGIPIFNIDAGYDAFYGDEGYEVGGGSDFFNNYESNDANAFCCRLRGDSMETEFPQGHIVLVEPNKEVRSMDYVIIATESLKTFKQYIPLANGKIKLHPLNPIYDDRIIHMNDIKYIWKVVMSFKQY